MIIPEDALREMIGQEVVVDVASPYVFLGTLIGEDRHYLILDDADAHDLRDTNTSRELYIVETRRLGIRSNRKRVWVRLSEVVSISALADVVI
jgi:hypothetical protein